MTCINIFWKSIKTIIMLNEEGGYMINKIILSAILVAFLGGLLLGYGIWSQRQVEEEVDIKTLLTEAIKRVEAIKRENRNFQKEFAAAQVAIQEAKLVETRTAQLEVNINALKEENANLQSTVDKLQYEMAAIKSATPESGEHSGVSSDQEMQLAELQEKNNELAAKLQQAEKAQQELQTTVSRLETELASSPVTEEGKPARLSELESTNQSLSKEILGLQEENQRLISTVARLEKAMADAKNQPQALEEKGQGGDKTSTAEGANTE